jgi:hypothetical protein
MTFGSCRYEKEISEALKIGHRPEGCGPELRAHVESCANCSDLVLVRQTFQEARSESLQAAPAIPPGLLWWRAQLRRRNAVTQRISQPITIAQTFAWIVMAVVTIVLVASQYRHGLRWISWWSEFSPSRALHFWTLAAAGLDWNLSLLIPGVGVLALLSGLAVYLASER